MEESSGLAAAAAAVVLAACVRTSCYCAEERNSDGTADDAEHAEDSLRNGGGASSSSSSTTTTSSSSSSSSTTTPTTTTTTTTSSNSVSRRSTGKPESSGGGADPENGEDDCERAAWRYIAEAAALIKAADQAAVAQLALALRRSSSALRLVPQSGTCAHATALWQRSVAFDILGKWSMTAILQPTPFYSRLFSHPVWNQGGTSLLSPRQQRQQKRARERKTGRLLHLRMLLLCRRPKPSNNDVAV
jgi:hypothetical protein